MEEQQGFTVKEMLVRLDKGQQQILEEVRNVSERMTAHENQPGHTVTVQELDGHESRIIVVERWQERRQGNIDVLKWFFGASALSLATSLAALYSTLTGGK